MTKKNVTDLLLHLVLALIVITLGWIWLPLAVVAALYLREQGQARSWTLNWSLHKHTEWMAPGAAICAIYYMIMGF